MSLYGINGNSYNETYMHASRHKHKFRYAFTNIFLTDKNYRMSSYPKLGRLYFYPICLIVHWFYLLTHKLGSFFKFLFGKIRTKNYIKNLVFKLISIPQGVVELFLF